MNGPASLTIRAWGSVLLPLVLAEGALGVASVGAGSSPGSPLLVAHVGFGVLVGGVTLAAFRATRSVAVPRAWWSVRLTTLCVALTGITGTAFLVSGFAQGLDVDRVLGLLDLVGAVAMIVWGGAPAPDRPERGTA